MKSAKQPSLTRGPSGFTLLELLVVIGVIGILAALLLPALSSSKQAAMKAECISNLRQIGIAVHMYAEDFSGRIPYGPKAPPFTSPTSFYPATGTPTSLLSIRHGHPAGLGLLLDSYLSKTPKVLFCPGADDKLNATAELDKVGSSQAQGSYFYRHAGNVKLADPPDGLAELPQSTSLYNPGRNRDGLKIRTLVMDTQFLSPPGLDIFNIRQRTHHQQKNSNALLYDGSVRSLKNRSRYYTVDLRDYSELHNAFNRILEVFERADAAP